MSNLEMELEMIIMEIEIMTIRIANHAFAAFGNLLDHDIEAHIESKNKMRAEHDKLMKYLNKQKNG